MLQSNKNMKKLLLIVAFIALAVQSYAYTERNLLTKGTDSLKLREQLITDQNWIHYPNYQDRVGWDKLFAENKQSIIQSGEKYLKYQWKVVQATDYLDFKRKGDRVIMENPYFENQTALFNLVLAELAEGKGRFLDQIINGVYLDCEMTSWVLSAHFYLSERNKESSLPDYRENLIDLFAAQTGATLSWTYYFLHNEFDKVNPIISERLRFEIQKRILDPYLNDNFWWMALPPLKKGYESVNNWNPWCNANVIQCFMLLEKDNNKLAGAAWRSMCSVDKYINANKDGACDEGPGYWNVAGGKLFDYLQLISSLTGGKVSIVDQPVIKSIGEYIFRANAGNGWVVNFSDATAKAGGNAYLIYNFGRAVGSPEMMHFAVYLDKLDPGKGMVASNDIFRTLQNALSYTAFNHTPPEFTPPAYTWYPKTEYCFMTDKKGNFVAAKGGNNAENHNHNDVGSFIYFSNSVPIIVDAGVGKYTAQTFSPDRYKIWSMQSNYHNLPLINGVAQHEGGTYKAKNTTFDKGKMVFSTDISGAYTKEAEVNSWVRSYGLNKGVLKIEDAFQLNKTLKPNQINFMVWGRVSLAKPGKINIKVQNEEVELIYNQHDFTPTLDTIPLDDPKFTKYWGKELYRFSLVAKDLKMAGRYQYIVRKVKKTPR
jgi:hypothetical protein